MTALALGEDLENDSLEDSEMLPADIVSDDMKLDDTGESGYGPSSDELDIVIEVV